jgi:GTP-binding protein YchF
MLRQQRGLLRGCLLQLSKPISSWFSSASGPCSVGIVGLPNVGKSTLFNALTATQLAQAANFPFCTIEPNIGRVAVPDARLDQLAAAAKSAKKIHSQLEFVDIAGLVKGASSGAGLGNKFLGHVRQVPVIAHVVRCYDDDDITHVEKGIDPARDAEIIETELLLADLQVMEKRLSAKKKDAGSGFYKKVTDALALGHPARSVLPATPDEAAWMRDLSLLTSKPMLFVCNVGERDAAAGNAHSSALQRWAASRGDAQVCIVSAKLEDEVAQLKDASERASFLEMYDLKTTGLEKVVSCCYSLLSLATFYTVGPQEARAWSFKRHSKAPSAAGLIHSDIQQRFICADVVSSRDFLDCGGEAGAREKGRLRVEGKEYVMNDGDVVHFKHNA